MGISLDAVVSHHGAADVSCAAGGQADSFAFLEYGAKEVPRKTSRAPLGWVGQSVVFVAHDLVDHLGRYFCLAPQVRHEYFVHHLSPLILHGCSTKGLLQKTKGLFFYKRVPELEATVLSASRDLDSGGVATLELIYANPEMNVLGPNHIGRE